jgi:hypothetical protein
MSAVKRHKLELLNKEGQVIAMQVVSGEHDEETLQPILGSWMENFDHVVETKVTRLCDRFM